MVEHRQLLVGTEVRLPEVRHVDAEVRRQAVRDQRVLRDHVPLDERVAHDRDAPASCRSILAIRLVPGVPALGVDPVAGGDLVAHAIDTPLARRIPEDLVVGPVESRKIRRRQDAPQDLLAYLEKLTEDTRDHDFIVAAFAGFYGDSDLVLKTFVRSADLWVFWYPLFEEVRQRPEFQLLVRDLGLVDYWRANGWNDYCKPDSGETFICT